MTDNEDRTIHPKRLTKADIARIKASLPKMIDLSGPSDKKDSEIEFVLDYGVP